MATTLLSVEPPEAPEPAPFAQQIEVDRSQHERALQALQAARLNVTRERSVEPSSRGGLVLVVVTMVDPERREAAEAEARRCLRSTLTNNSIPYIDRGSKYLDARPAEPKSWSGVFSQVIAVDPGDAQMAVARLSAAGFRAAPFREARSYRYQGEGHVLDVTIHDDGAMTADAEAHATARLDAELAGAGIEFERILSRSGGSTTLSAGHTP